MILVLAEVVKSTRSVVDSNSVTDTKKAPGRSLFRNGSLKHLNFESANQLLQ